MGSIVPPHFFNTIDKTIKIMQKEIWKDVIGYEGYYMVSNLGRVKSLDRLRSNGDGRYIQKGIVLKPVLGGKYYGVMLSVYGNKKNNRIHILVAMAFLGHEPNGFNLVVDHIDFDKTNNNVDNLRIITSRANTSQEHLSSLSKYIGVTWGSKNRWRAMIRINGKQKFLGSFINEYDAHLAYQAALKEIT